MKDNLQVLLSEEEIRVRVQELSVEINDYIGDDEAVVVANLKGAVIFYADLFRLLRGSVRMDFIETQSYVGDKSSGAVKILKDLSEDPRGKKLILVEDILDTGYTFRALLEYISSVHKPLELKICVLLDKQENRKVEGLDLEWVGFTIPNKFVVGYGLDCDQNFRNLPYIAYKTS